MPESEVLHFISSNMASSSKDFQVCSTFFSISFPQNMASIPVTTSRFRLPAFSASSKLCLQNLSFLTSKSSSSSDKLHRGRPRCHLDATAIPIYTSEVAPVADKLHRLVLEFQSLLEPIDRVRRLLHYAGILDPSDESIRVPENRVRGCATEVWLDVKIDECNRMRFQADSDSEIAKGYCSCLIWMLGGAEPWEVMKVRSHDLEAVNVGLHGREISRVNTWQNVLMSMQMRTKALVSKNGTEPPLLDPFIFSAVHHL